MKWELMTNGKIVDTRVWVDYFNAVIDERTDSAERFINHNQILMLPVIMQRYCSGSKIKNYLY